MKGKCFKQNQLRGERKFNEAMNPRRLIWADTLRGLLILVVVLGHSLQHGDYENRLLWNIIYSFHMAAFFVVSGYVGYKENYKTSSLIGKACQLLLPFLSWTVLGALINGSGFSQIINAFMDPDSSYWFVYVLFVILSLFIFIVQFSNRLGVKADIMLSGGVISLILIMIVTEFRVFGFQFISLYFGFYVLGYWLRKYKVKFSLTGVFTLGLVWFCLALFWNMHAVPAPLQWTGAFIPSSLIIYGYRYISALMGSLFFLGFAMNYMNRDSRFCKSLSYFGTISLGIYIIHIFIGKYIDPIYIPYFSSDTCASFVCVDFILKLVLSCLIVHLIQKFPVVSLLLLGKSKW